jgi:hypothetical protein
MNAQEVAIKLLNAWTEGGAFIYVNGRFGALTP